MKTACLLILLVTQSGEPVTPKVKVGSKSFTESVVLGEIVALLAEQGDYDVRHMKELGGTQILWSALLTGEIDLYPEYTGTIRLELFPDEILPDDEAMRLRLKQDGVLMTKPLGFNNSYAIGVKAEVASEKNIRAISDLRQHPNLRFGFSNEFMDRDDDWPGLRRKYQLEHENVRGLQHALAYRALDAGDLEVTDVYSTDPAIRKYGLTVLEDDAQPPHFPRYDAVFLYRADLVERAPDFVESLQKMSGRIDDDTMLNLNQQVELNKQSEHRVAANFVTERFGFEIEIDEPTLLERLWKTTFDHLILVVISLGAAIAVAVPLGIVAAKKPFTGQIILASAEIIQTIPGLALLVFMSVGFARMSLPTIGAPPVIVALFLYSLLPIIRNTMTGLTDVPSSLKESAVALGLTPLARLRLIELPMASRMILAGIKTTAVINVGYAALGGLIGAGGYGQPIMTGLRLQSEALMMEGAIPAAVLALLVKGVFEFSERYLVPQGLRIKTVSD